MSDPTTPPPVVPPVTPPVVTPAVINTVPDGPFAGYVGPDGKFKENWADSLPDSLKPTSATIAKYGTLGDVFTELHRVKSLGDTGVKIHADWSKAAPEELASYRTAIGAPAEAAGYGLHTAPEGFAGEWDSEFGQAIAEVMHKHNVPGAMAGQLIALEAARAAKAEAAADAAHKAHTEAQVAILTKKWGAETPKFVAQATAVATKFGIDLDAHNDANLIEVFQKLHDWTTADPKMRTAIGLPAEALAIMAENPRAHGLDIIRNPSNPWHSRYHANEPAAIKMVDELFSKAHQQ
jgi:hypothetical protein